MFLLCLCSNHVASLFSPLLLFMLLHVDFGCVVVVSLRVFDSLSTVSIALFTQGVIIGIMTPCVIMKSHPVVWFVKFVTNDAPVVCSVTNRTKSNCSAGLALFLDA